VAGFTEKSRKYLELAAANDKRASETEKKLFLEIASGYRELAELIDVPNSGAPN
jgi:hypothetical protein